MTLAAYLPTNTNNAAPIIALRIVQQCIRLCHDGAFCPVPRMPMTRRVDVAPPAPSGEIATSDPLPANNSPVISKRML